MNTHPPPTKRPDLMSEVLNDVAKTGVRRDTSRQWLGGMCAGVARRFDVDPILIRAAVIALALVGGLGVLLYVLAWLTVPDDSGRVLIRGLTPPPGEPRNLLSIALLALVVLLFAVTVVGLDPGEFVLILVLLTIAGLVLWRAHHSANLPAPEPAPEPLDAPVATATPAPEPSSMPAPAPEPAPVPLDVPAPRAALPSGVAMTPTATDTLPGTAESEYAANPPTTEWNPPPSPPATPPPGPPDYGATPPPPAGPRRRRSGYAAFTFVLGLSGIAFGVGYLLDGPLNFPKSAPLLGLICALGTASLATLGIGLSGRRSLLSAALVLTLGFTTAGGAVASHTWATEGAIRTLVPSLIESGDTWDNSRGAGQTTVDLRPLGTTLAALAPDGDRTTQQVAIDQGFGLVRVIVPDGVSLDIDAEVGFGDITIDPGLAPDVRADHTGPAQYLSVQVGQGEPSIIFTADLIAGSIAIEKG